ncbi:MAG: SDR family oxidoreductase [Actinobacteria bacterium]|nr:SDR family oxidoreductase [Actinomycetota bacterium]
MDIVTGSTGCIGNVLVRELVKSGRTVKSLIRSSSNTLCLKDCITETIKGDILDLESLIKAFRNADTVYHLASEISIMPGFNKYLWDINVSGTKNVIKACFECKVKKLVYTSSIHAIKEPHEGIIIDETMPFDPESPRGIYDKSKALASIEVLRAAQEGLHTVIVCPTAVIGPYDFRISYLGQLFIDYCNRKLNIIIDGAYDFVDVRDVASGHILASKNGKNGNYYILSGHRLTLDNLMTILEEITGIAQPKYKLPLWLAKITAAIMPAYYKLSNTKPRFTPYSLNTIHSNSYISHDKAEKELGYKPRPVEVSIKDTIEWFKINKLINK